jgi:hypothetical protein
MTEPSKSLLFQNHFLTSYGAFYAMWATIELILSYGITKYLNISEEDGHIVTSGMEFGRKITLLRNLVYKSKNPNKKKLISVLSKIQNESKRNVFAHSFVTSTEPTVTFVERSRGGDYKVTRHPYTDKEFFARATNVSESAAQLEQLLEMKQEDHMRFMKAAFSAETSSLKSPEPPKESAE